MFKVVLAEDVVIHKTEALNGWDDFSISNLSFQFTQVGVPVEATIKYDGKEFVGGVSGYSIVANLQYQWSGNPLPTKE